jgi:hypothetical protein
MELLLSSPNPEVENRHLKDETLPTVQVGTKAHA